MIAQYHRKFIIFFYHNVKQEKKRQIRRELERETRRKCKIKKEKKQLQ